MVEKVRFKINVFRPHENPKTAFSNSSGLDGRPKRRNKGFCVYNFLLRNVDGPSGAKHVDRVTEHQQTKGFMNKSKAVQ